MALDKTEKFN